MFRQEKKNKKNTENLNTIITLEPSSNANLAYKALSTDADRLG